MRVVVGSEGSRDFRQAELDRHLEAMSRLIARATRDGARSYRCTMIVRSAASAPAQALVTMRDALADARMQARAIVAKLEPQDDLRELFATLSSLAPDEPAAGLIRWARNPRLLEAHEQATYGETMSWSGDAMRRDPTKRNPLVLFDMDAPDATRLSRLAFKALWAASVPVPARHLVEGRPAKPSGAYEQAAEAPVKAPRPHLRGWPLVRH
jgi:hypothetical protein